DFIFLFFFFCVEGPVKILFMGPKILSSAPDYNPQYISHVKYWCQGRMREFCTSLARTDEPESAPNSKGRVTIADDPTQHVFTVSMRELTEEDSGWYRCGVELGGMWVSDSTASLYISVIQGMSVVSSLLSADEGSSVTVQCLYSKNFR
uniref:Polymeric immunoglobulin receptor n=1 Tax=Cyprinus carpio TaxID=7962 RepID=A0A8C2HXN6_CYPCA